MIYLDTGELSAPVSKEEKGRVIRRHLALQMQYKGEYTGIREMRKHLAWYSAGMPGSAQFRNAVNLLETEAEMLKAVEQMFGAG